MDGKRTECCIIVSESNLFKIPNIYDYVLVLDSIQVHISKERKNANDVNSLKPA